MKKINLLLLLSLCLIFLGSCSKSAIENVVDSLTPDIETPEMEVEVEEEEEEIIGAFTAKVNGDDFIASKSLELIDQEPVVAFLGKREGFYLFTIITFDVERGLKSPKLIQLSFFGANFEDVSVGTTYTTIPGVITEPGAVALYGENENTDIEDGGIDSTKTEEISIEITAINRDKKLISGKFSFVVIDENTNTIFNITEGVFTDVAYEVQ